MGKSELVFLISFTCNYMVSVSYSWCFGYATEFVVAPLGLSYKYFAMETMQSHITDIDLLLRTLYFVFKWSH